MDIYPLKAAHGDAIIIKIFTNERKHVIVIDGGSSVTAESIADIYDTLDYIDLLMLTHYDEDHISGLLEYFSRHTSELPNALYDGGVVIYEPCHTGNVGSVVLRNII